jgi:hypothetical protein
VPLVEPGAVPVVEPVVEPVLDVPLGFAELLAAPLSPLGDTLVRMN